MSWCCFFERPSEERQCDQGVPDLEVEVWALDTTDHRPFRKTTISTPIQMVEPASGRMQHGPGDTFGALLMLLPVLSALLAALEG
jgi:hypothetical protein